jgi:hypothetical protein
MSMRRVAFGAVVGLLLVALIAPVASAARPAPSFVGKASAGNPDGAIHLLAKVKHAVRGSTFSATATVHFASGDVVVNLTQRGKSFVAGGKAAVPADQPVGTVAVDITITYNGVPTAVPTFNAKIEPDDSSV